MKPELEAELDRIGWKWVRRRPWLELYYEMTLRENAGLVAANPTEAKAALVQHRALCKSVVSVVEGLRALSADAATTINLECTPIEARDLEWPDHVTSSAAALENLAPGLILWTEFLQNEASKARRGGQRNEPAYRITEAMAEIYVIGLGERPTIGRREDGAGPSTLFGRVATRVLSSLNVKVSDVFPPCDAAIKRLTEERMKQLLNWHQPQGTGSAIRMERIPRSR